MTRRGFIARLAAALALPLLPWRTKATAPNAPREDENAADFRKFIALAASMNIKEDYSYLCSNPFDEYRKRKKRATPQPVPGEEHLA